MWKRLAVLWSVVRGDAGVLPKGYQVFDSRLLSNLLKTLSRRKSGLCLIYWHLVYCAK